MKKIQLLAYAGAIALLSTGFTACSSSEDSVAEEPKVENNPTYDPNKNEVTTQFVFNVSSGSSATTRQSGVATQASTSLSANDFRGIDNSYIMCFKQGTDGNPLSAAATAEKSFDMSRIVAAAALDNDNSRRVLEMSLPLNTNTMLFYGKAINESTTSASYNTYGHLDDFTVTDNLANVNFQLGRRLSSAKKTEFQEVQKLLATVLTCIISTNRGEAAVAADATPGDGIPAYGFDIATTDAPDLQWSAYNSVKSPVTTTKDITPLEQKLGNAYKEMTTIQTAELRNASGPALKATIQSLWSIVNAVRCATPTNKEEAIAKYMAHLISLHLAQYFTYETLPPNGASVTGVAFRDAGSIITAIYNDSYWPTATAGTKPASSDFNDISSMTVTDLGNYPAQFNLPQGSTHVKFDDTKKAFYYVENYNSSAVGGGTFTVDDYYYPAELCYFGNSPLRVSNEEHVVGDYPVSVSLWNTEATSSWSSDWSVSHVRSSTRSVAMKNDINYGTSLLCATVGYNTLTLKDNNKAIQQRDYGVVEDDKTINVTGTSFKLVGVVIGDQWPKVGWDFLPKTTDTDPNYRKGYIYDNQITNNGVIPASTTTASEPNYTLVFDNYQDMRVATPAVPENTQPKVYIALEFQNNTGVDFFGKDNLIANGSNFYLIGELDPSSMTGPALPAYHALPPYDAGCTTNTIPRVFIQDHMTTAKFKIGVNSLKYAYLTVPDLRSSSVTLGLSVDLKWEAGLTFDNVIIGGN